MRQARKSFWIVFLVVLSAGVVTVLAENSVGNFGINQSEVKPQIASSLVSGSLPGYPDRKAYHAASAAAQVAFVNSTLGWVKAYTESAAFKADYAKLRESNKPAPPESKGSPDDQYAAYLAEQRKSLEEMKKNVAAMSPDMQKQMAPVIKQMEATIEETAKNPEMARMIKQGAANEKVENQKKYEEAMAEFAKKYPADPRALIASRLHEFLNLTQNIPFDAKLTPGPEGRMRFADPQYEAKSTEWKMCFRAGREPVQAARAFVADWLHQIEGK